MFRRFFVVGSVASLGCGVLGCGSGYSNRRSPAASPGPSEGTPDKPSIEVGPPVPDITARDKKERPAKVPQRIKQRPGNATEFFGEHGEADR
jgi:hypothetical protein